MKYKVTYMWEFDEATIAEFDLIEERYPTVYLWEDDEQPLDHEGQGYWG